MATAQAPQTGEAGSARPIESYRDDARRLEPADFAERHGHAFLLLTATTLRAPRSTASTHVELLDDSTSGARTGRLLVLVFPLRGPSHIMALGRSAQCDVVIPDESVSRTHAFVKRNDDGRWLIVDAGSSNGTQVNGKSVLVRGSGPPTALTPGCTVRLGAVELTFSTPEALCDYAKQMG
jgi:hypothetical protein